VRRGTWLFGIAFLAALCGGCAGGYSAQRASGREDAVAKRFEPAVGGSTLYVFVDQYRGAVPVRVDSELVGELSTGTFLVVEVAPGRHRISSDASRDVGVDVDARSGGIHFVGFYPGWDGYAFTWVEADRAKNVVRRLALAQRPETARQAPNALAGTYGAEYTRKVAVVVGINEYQRWPSLEGAVSDGHRIARLLRGLGFETIVELYDGAASREQILRELAGGLLAGTDADSLVLVFFAGHGQTEDLRDDQRRGYIVPADGDPENPVATAISMETLRSVSSRLDAKHVLFVMDSCYSGLGFVRGIRVGNDTDYPSRARSERAIQMITAGTQGQRALEVNGVGLFTDVFAEALRGAGDLDGDGFLTASEIGEFVKTNVSARSEKRQTPQFGTLEGSGEVVFDLAAD